LRLNHLKILKMEQKDSKIFNKQTMQILSAYCKLNNIEDVDGFIKKCFDTGFNIEKYGLLGETLNDGEKDLKTGVVEEKHVIKEVIVEKQVEVPVEVIKYVDREVIKEVPIEKIVTITNESEPIIKEVIVEVVKEVENNDKLKMLGETLLKLRKELSLKDKRIEELESINKQLESVRVNQNATYLNGSNLNRKL